jgi:hypothetical protein
MKFYHMVAGHRSQIVISPFLGSWPVLGVVEQLYRFFRAYVALIECFRIQAGDFFYRMQFHSQGVEVAPQIYQFPRFRLSKGPLFSGPAGQM